MSHKSFAQLSGHLLRGGGETVNTVCEREHAKEERAYRTRPD